MVILARTNRQMLEDVEHVAEELVGRLLKCHFNTETAPPNRGQRRVFFVQILREIAKRQVILMSCSSWYGSHWDVNPTTTHRSFFGRMVFDDDGSVRWEDDRSRTLEQFVRGVSRSGLHGIRKACAVHGTKLFCWAEHQMDSYDLLSGKVSRVHDREEDMQQENRFPMFYKDCKLQPRDDPVLVVFKNQLLAIGGTEGGLNDDSSHARSFVWQPGEKDEKGAWRRIADLPENRNEHCAAVHNGKLLVAGGENWERGTGVGVWNRQGDVRQRCI